MVGGWWEGWCWVVVGGFGGVGDGWLVVGLVGGLVGLVGLVGGLVGTSGDKADSNSARSPRASSICISW